MPNCSVCNAKKLDIWFDSKKGDKPLCGKCYQEDK